MKQLFLYGFYGIGNVGNEAMLRAFMDPVERAFSGELATVVAVRHPDAAYDRMYGVESIPNLEYPSREASSGRWLRGLNPDDSTEYLQLVRHVAAADLVVIGPGQYLVETGERGLLKGSLAQFAAVVTACVVTHTPCYGLALACESLVSPWAKLQVGALLPALAHLTFRDSRSVENLMDAGIRVPEHEVLGDLALAGEPAPTGVARIALQEAGVPPRRGARLAVACRNVYWLEEGGAALYERLARTLELWLETPGRDVLMVPQNTYSADGGRDDDRIAAREIVGRLPAALRSRIHQMGGVYDERTTEALYGDCDVTLSARLHGSVFSCKQGTPPLVLAFMDKTRGFFSRLDVPGCTAELLATPSELSQQLERILENRDAISADILASVARIRASARLYSDRAIALLKRPVDPMHVWAQQTFVQQCKMGS